MVTEKELKREIKTKETTISLETQHEHFFSSGENENEKC